MSNEIYSIQEIKDRLRPVFENRALDRVWIFGSYAKGAANAFADNIRKEEKLIYERKR